MPEPVVRLFPNPFELAAGCRVTDFDADRRMRELMLWPKARKSPPEVIAYLKEQGRLK